MASLSNKIFSPMIFILYNVIIVTISFLIPSSVYLEYLNEPKFVDYRIYIYVILCLLMFWGGYSFTPNITVGIKVKYIIENTRLMRLFSILVRMILISIILVNLIIIFKFFSYIGFTNYIKLYQEGAFVSGGVFDIYSESVKGLSWFILGTPVVIMVALWINWKSNAKLVSNLIIYCALIMSIIRPALRGDRGTLIGLLVSLVLLRLYFLSKENKLSTIKLLFTLSIVVLFGISIFVFFQLSRFNVNSDIWDFSLKQIFGYYLGSFNRFGIQIEYGGPFPTSNGYFTIFGPLATFPILNKLLPLESWITNLTGFQMPKDTFWIWLQYGVNPNFNVVTAFGYSFIDFGWFGCLSFLF